MARNQNVDSILAVGMRDRAHRGGLTDAIRQFFVADCCTVWDTTQRIPDSLLKRSAVRCHWDRKFDQPPVEVRSQFLSQLIEPAMLSRQNGSRESPSHCREVSLKHPAIGVFEQ